mmetsp:Transcript_41287/g.90081  ORF Transcript_41287/g.90081 Transcript_41287/m.90081 type:complete len:1096 (+) Transcript_41287:94-3381(+)
MRYLVYLALCSHGLSVDAVDDATPTAIGAEAAQRSATDANLEKAIVKTSDALANRDTALLGEIRGVQEAVQGTGTELSTALTAETSKRRQNDNLLVREMAKLREENDRRISVALTHFKSVREGLVKSALSKLDRERQKNLMKSIDSLDKKKQARLKKMFAAMDVKRQKVLDSSFNRLKSAFQEALGKQVHRQSTALRSEMRSRHTGDTKLKDTLNKRKSDFNAAMQKEMKTRKAEDVNATKTREAAVAHAGLVLIRGFKKDLGAVTTRLAASQKRIFGDLSRTAAMRLASAKTNLGLKTATAAKVLDTELTTKLLQEAAARKAGDTQTQDQISTGLRLFKDGLVAEAAARKKGDTDGASARSAELKSLGARLRASFTKDIKALALKADKQFSSETTARKTGDQTISDAIKSKAKGMKAAVVAEAEARQAADKSLALKRAAIEQRLNSGIQDLAGKRGKLLDVEAQSLAGVDKQNAANLLATKEAFEKDLGTEASARKAADEGEAKLRKKGDVEIASEMAASYKRMVRLVDTQGQQRNASQSSVERTIHTADAALAKDVKAEIETREATDLEEEAAREKSIQGVVSNIAKDMNRDLAKADAHRKEVLKKKLADMDERREAILKKSIKEQGAQMKAADEQAVAASTNKMEKEIEKEKKSMQTEDDKLLAKITKAEQGAKNKLEAEKKAQAAGDRAQDALRKKDFADVAKRTSAMEQGVMKALQSEGAARKAADDVEDKYDRAQMGKTLTAVKKEKGARIAGDKGSFEFLRKEMNLLAKRSDRNLRVAVNALNTKLDAAATAKLKKEQAAREESLKKDLDGMTGAASKYGKEELAKVEKAKTTEVKQETGARAKADAELREQVKAAEAKLAKAQTAQDQKAKEAIQAEAKEREAEDKEIATGAKELSTDIKDTVEEEITERKKNDAALNRTLGLMEKGLDKKVNAETHLRKEADRKLETTWKGEKREVVTAVIKQEQEHTATLETERKDRWAEDQKIKKKIASEMASIREDLAAEEQERIKGDKKKKALLLSIHQDTEEHKRRVAELKEQVESQRPSAALETKDTALVQTVAADEQQLGELANVSPEVLVEELDSRLK